MLLTWITTAALAGAGFYHPADIAAASKAYAEVSAVAQADTQVVQERATAVAVGLQNYDMALDLLGDRAPAAERERYQELLTQFNREKATTQAFMDVWIEDFDAQFLAAVDRALVGLGATAEVCAKEIPAGRSVPGMPTPMKANPDCTGDDLNAKIVAAIDTDPKLASELKEILAMDFPTITLPADPQPLSVPGDEAVSVADFFKANALGSLKAIDTADTKARSDIQAEIALGASPEELAALTDTARDITAKTDAAYASLAAPVLAAVDKANAKAAKKSLPTVGWCAQPQSFGGCDVPLSAVAPKRLAADKKVAKALP